MKKESGRKCRRLFKVIYHRLLQSSGASPRYVFNQYNGLWVENSIWNLQIMMQDCYALKRNVSLLHFMGRINTVQEQVGVAVNIFIRIREMLGSNLGRDIFHDSLSSSWFTSLPPGKLRDSALIRS
jgi:hypothetical protein